MRIALLGDIALIGKYDKTISKDVNHRVSIIRKVVKECDYVIANLESPLTAKEKTNTCKGVYIKSNPINVETLKYMGITHVTLANNHMFDYGKKGSFDTINALKSAGIKYVGLNGKPLLLNKGNSTAVLDGFCCLSANALNYGKKKGQIKMLSYENMRDFLEYGKKTNSIPIASVHFGVEGLHYPSKEHINLFRILAEDYKYILHGNHPHCIQGFENYKDSLLIYAQGDLCFDKTPVTSFKTKVNKSNNNSHVDLERHKTYIIIIEIEENKIVSFNTIGISDLDTNIIHRDPEVDRQLDRYCSDLKQTLESIQNCRLNELKRQRTRVKDRDISFYINRINYKYIGAYINGKIHAKKYKKIIGKYKEV